MFLLQYRGELAALSAALIWACASIVYTGVGRQLSPLVLNFTKGWIAIVLLLLTFLATGQSFPNVGSTGMGLLLLSGAIGIGFGDTAYFKALNLIGARRTLVLETLAPALSALLAQVFLNETLTLTAWFGIGVTLLGVIWVVLDRSPDPNRSAPQMMQGLIYGGLAALQQAIGSVLSRSAFLETPIDSLGSTLIRLIGGTVILFIWLLLQRPAVEIVKPMRSRSLFLVVAGTAFISTYLGIWLQQTALKFAPTGIAQALTSTSPLFVLPLAKMMGEHVSFRATVGVFIALIGVSILFGRG